MKSGMMLLELMIAMVITVMVSGLLMGALYQGLRYQSVVDELTSVHMKVEIARYQLQQDIAGAFVPLQGLPQPKSVNRAAVAQKKEGEERVEKIFFATNKNKMLDQLTFITNNPLAIYWSQTTGRATPKRARVVYRLEKEKGYENSYTLVRQEGVDLQLKNYAKNDSKTRAYTILNGIRELKCEFIAAEPVEVPKEKVQQKIPQEPQIKYNAYPTWNSDEWMEEKDAFLLPQFVKISGQVWNEKHTATYPLQITIPLFSVDKVSQPVASAAPPAQPGEQPPQQAPEAVAAPQPEQKVEVTLTTTILEPPVITENNATVQLVRDIPILSKEAESSLFNPFAKFKL